MRHSIRESDAELTRPDAARVAMSAGGGLSASRAKSRLRKQFLHNKTADFGAVLMLLILLSATLAPLLSPTDPLAMTSEHFATPSGRYWLGTDQFGRDLLSRLLYGARTSMLVAFSAITLAGSVGTAVGLCAGYFGGATDLVLMRAIEVLLAFPALLLALAVVATLGGGMPNLVLAIALAYMPVFSRVVRGSALSIREQEFVQASRALGATDLRVMARDILPNVVSPLIVQGTFSLSTAIMVEAALSFLGLGVQPPTPSWGVMLSEARNFMQLYPWLAIAPGCAVTLAVLGFNLVGDGLRDILDPRLIEIR